MSGISRDEYHVLNTIINDVGLAISGIRRNLTENNPVLAYVRLEELHRTMLKHRKDLEARKSPDEEWKD